MAKHKPPTQLHLAGMAEPVPVEVLNDPVTVNGEEWVTLMPGEDDERLWEFSLTTGRTIQVM